MIFNIEKILDALGIENEQKGRSRWALCPFHDDHNATNWNIVDEPSSNRHGYFRCYACGAKGGLLGLVAHVLGLDAEDPEAIRSAVRWVRSSGSSLPSEIRRPVVKRVESARRGFRVPRGVMFTPFGKWPKLAIGYIEDRKISERTVDDFGLGYAVDGRLANRIVIPIRNRVGAVVAYTARSFIGAEKRYLEPKQDEHADQRAIFGEHLWPPRGSRELLLVTEGSFDAMAVREQLEGAVVGAILGSEVDPEKVAAAQSQLERIASFRRIVIVSDPDRAGDKLAGVIADIATSRVSEVPPRIERALMPPGVDAAALAERAPDELRSILIGAILAACPTRPKSEPRSAPRSRSGEIS